MSYDKHDMSDLMGKLNKDILLCPSTCSNHFGSLSVNDVKECVNSLKRGKHDGSTGYTSDHIIYGPDRLYVYLSLLFSSMVIHGHAPGEFAMSTLVPIPKNCKKSLNNSNNYRAIALSSIFGKLLDKIIIVKCQNIFTTTNMQYGFKKKTFHCTVYQYCK